VQKLLIRCRVNKNIVSISSTFYAHVFCMNVFLAVTCEWKKMPKSTFVLKFARLTLIKLTAVRKMMVKSNAVCRSRF
jgi:hypothetical protein